LTCSCCFKDIEIGIRENDPGKVVVLMATFLDQKVGLNLPVCPSGAVI
jgi:hypothetical protein